MTMPKHTLTVEELQRTDAEELLAQIKATKEPLTLKEPLTVTSDGHTAALGEVVIVDIESYRELVGELAKIQALEQFDKTIADLEKSAEFSKKRRVR